MSVSTPTAYWAALAAQGAQGLGGTAGTNGSTGATGSTGSTGAFGGNSTTLTASTAYTGTTLTTTTLVLPSEPISATHSGHCSIIWESSSTTQGKPTFGVGMNNAPTDLWVISKSFSTATAVLYTTVTTTTNTNVTASLTPSAITIGYPLELDFILKTGATNPVTLTIYYLNTGTGTITLEPGSYCAWLD